MARVEYCADCHRGIGIGCACGLSFKDKHVTIHNDALPSKTKVRYWDEGALKSTFGEDAREKSLENTQGRGYNDRKVSLAEMF